MRNLSGHVRIIAALPLCLALATASPKPRFKTLAVFHGRNGANADAGLVQGFDGNLYSTTAGRGGHPNLKGVVFRVTPGGTLTALQNLPGHSYAGLVQATDGNLYGTTSGVPIGPPTVFKVTPGGTLTRLYTFCSQPNCTDGFNPEAPLIQASDGNFYGTTAEGTANTGCGDPVGCGVVFKITPAGALTTLYSFCQRANCADGAQPLAPLVQASDGNFYGTTSFGGAPCAATNDGCGTVFRITPEGVLTTIYSSFCAQPSCPTSSFPISGLVQAGDGNLYGVTQGTGGGQPDAGSVFRITLDGTLTTLYKFCSQPNCADGAETYAGVVLGSDGNLYGTTAFGGAGPSGAILVAGTIYKMTLAGELTTLHSFFCRTENCPDGVSPMAPLLQGTDGAFYGTTTGTGYPSIGAVYRLSVGLGPFVTTVPTSGAPSSAVTILGTHLTGATSVTFSGVPVSTFTVNSTGSAITTSVPTGAVSGEVRVKLPKRTLKSNVLFSVTQ